MVEGIVDAGEATAEDRALADLHRLADEGREQERIDQLDQDIGAEGEAGVYSETEVHQAPESDCDIVHTVSFALRPPDGQPILNTSARRAPQSGYRALNSSSPNWT
jgi:hypothetical protein